MIRERALKVVLVLVGLLFTAGIYPLTMFMWQEPALAMMLSVYVSLGIFLLLAAPNPLANRSLIAFTAWSSFAHAGIIGRWRETFNACGRNPRSICAPFVCLTSFFVQFGVIR